MSRYVSLATLLASIAAGQAEDLLNVTDEDHVGLTFAPFISFAHWKPSPNLGAEPWSNVASTLVPPTITDTATASSTESAVGSDSHNIPDFFSSLQPAVPPFSVPTNYQQLTKTEYVYQTVDITITASPPEGTDQCSPQQPPSWPGLPGPFPSPPTCFQQTGALKNEEQVGHSHWGSLCQPYFPQWLPDENGNPDESAPWGEKRPDTHDPVVPGHIPTTNVTRYYDFTVTRGQISPDGVLRDVMLVNNQFPGPAIEANWGDWIEITVHNNISYPLEGTALHWHGFLQRGSNWADGVPSVAQCPIAPYHSYTYRIPAQLYGSSWYHAHYSAQYTAGIVGPIIIYGPTQTPYDIDVGPVMLSDWYHQPYFSLVSDAVGTDMAVIPPTSNSLLINGRGRYDCSVPSYGDDAEWLSSSTQDNTPFTCIDGADLSRFKFVPGKVHRLRLMNMGADGVLKFTLDGHQMTVIAYDYVPIKPVTTNFVTLAVGQRADVLITADNLSANTFWMRTSAPGGTTCGGSAMSETLAIVYYQGADLTVVPSSVRDVNDTLCENAPLVTTEPEYAITPSENPYHFDVALSLELNATGHYEWRMNGQTFRANFNYPSLFLAAEGNTSYPDSPQWNIVNFGQNRSVVVNVTNGTPFAHPFHLHGHNFYVLNTGPSNTVWDGSIVNPQNPMRRDTHIVPALGYAAIAFEADNPGIWPFHCHVAWHLSGGLAMNFISQPQDIPAMPTGEREKTCADWTFYSDHNVVDQIDAGS